MKIKEVTVRVGRVIGLPGYSSIKGEAHLTATVEEGDKLAQVFGWAWELVDDQIKRRLGKYLDKPRPGKSRPEPKWLREDTPEIKKAKIEADKRIKRAPKMVKT